MYVNAGICVIECVWKFSLFFWGGGGGGGGAQRWEEGIHVNYMTCVMPLSCICLPLSINTHFMGRTFKCTFVRIFGVQN